MKSSLYRLVGGTLLALLGCASASQGAEGLTRSSPFIPSGGQSGPVATTENSPLELRGIMTTANGNVYGLFDPVKRQSSWVKVNEAGNDYTVRTYDASKDAITVEYQGRILTLALKTAKIESMAPSSLPQTVGMTAQVRPGVNPLPPPPLTPTPVDEARRLESVAAEVRRRRALRQSAAQQPAGPGQQPTPLPTLPTTMPPQSTTPAQNSPAVLPR